MAVLGAEDHGPLAFLDVAAPDIESCALGAARQDQASIGSTGQAKRAADRVYRIVGFHLAGVVQGHDAYAAIIGKSVNVAKRLVVALI